MFLSDHRELVLAGVSLGENLTIVLVATCLYLFAAHLHQVVDLLAYRHKLVDVFSGQWVKIVVYVLLDRVEHTAQ